jgi:hypothetical protein
MSEKPAAVRDQMRAVLTALTEDERRILSSIVQVEREYLHQKDPPKTLLRPELIKAVKEVIK